MFRTQCYCIIVIVNVQGQYDVDNNYVQTMWVGSHYNSWEAP